MTAEQKNLTEGKIFSKLLFFALPVLGALVLQAMYGAVDLLVVGKYGTAADISAVSTGTQILHSVTGLITGLAMGTTVLIGKAIGEKRPEDAGHAIAGAIALFAVIGGILTALIPLFSPVLADLMQAPVEAREQTILYIMICGFGILFIVGYNLLGSIFRGMGDSKTPLLAVIIACVLNIAGDFFLVGSCGMGTAGAALATIGSQGISVIICFLMIRKRGLPFPFSKESFRGALRFVKSTVKLGFPIALQDFMVSVSFLVILAIVNRLGVIASAGMGVAEKVCAFIMLIPSAFSQALSAFVAQNMGAGLPRRARKGLACSIAISFTIGILISYIGVFHGDWLTSIFSTERPVIDAGWQYLKAYAIDVLLTSWMFCFVGYFNGCGKTTFVMLQGIVSAFGVRIPVSYLASLAPNPSLFTIGLATPCSTFLQIILCVLYFRHCLKKEVKC